MALSNEKNLDPLKHLKDISGYLKTLAEGPPGQGNSDDCDPIRYGAVGNGVADDTVALQKALDLNKVVCLGGSNKTYKISGELTVKSGTTIRAQGAKIQQTTNLTSILNITGRTDIVVEGVTFEDTGAGHVANDVNPHAAIFGDGAVERVRVFGCTFTDVTYAAIYFAAASQLSVLSNDIMGPGAAVIPASSSLRCYGLLFDTGCSDFTAIGNDISELLHGIRIERSVRGVCSSNSIHDITGQHGFYVGAGVQNLSIADNEVFDVALQGIKVQAQNGFDDVRNISITGNSVFQCGDSGITLSNAAGADAQTAKVLNAVVTGNAVADCTGSGFSIQNTIGGIISNNAVSSPAQSGVAYSSCDYLKISGNLITDAGRSGIGETAFQSSNIDISDNVLHNVATAAFVNDQYGIFAQNLDAHFIRRNRITSSVAGMQYGIFLAGGDQTNSVLAENEVYSADDYGLRTASGVTAFSLFKDNTLNGTLGLAFNTPALPSVASAATLTIPTQHDVIRITGTTNITTINTGGHTGRRVTFVFDSALTVVRGSNVFVSSDFTTSQFDTLTMCCDGSNWYEIARSVN